ncbi:outer membrane beta-barrel protein [Bacteriovorax sp. PP10]|uniref:Outer membrane beta-barrel protein n=1 Tax=Bacteriovorax antarcticus TaxID=3088717 RepID=A0ABU5VRP9_9BACT|nr:outer membrane beta-barrel protein [Bacteriovorax sp. PP10]MEA9355735.1 outer membrane beta-barrel protein [Bacteriovorax sp. PP10]
MKKIILLSSMMMAFSGLSYAQDSTDNAGGLFVEPMITWERGRGDVNFPSPINSADTELDGFGVGARFGGHVYNTIFLAVDGRYSIPKFKDNKINQDADAKAWNVGPVVGMQMPTPFGLRVWGGWIVAGGVDVDKSQNVKEEFKSGQGYRIGAGVKLALVSLNIEYQKIKYDNTVIEEVGVFTPNSNRGDIELTNEAMVLSVSFPIAI